ncbi:MAG: hypothetical protein LC131_06895 [Anaerolineae bacterium]|nr:hypothetical protein [Anaerolineae bacterium]
MCQAFEGEQNYLLARDKHLRQKGYDAQKAGVPRDGNPESDHENPEYSDKRQWWFGWDTAAKGREAW